MTNGTGMILNEIDERCGCRRAMVSHLTRRAVFSELDPHERYFPMVAEEGVVSFYGIPPEADQPLAEKPTLSTQPTQNHGERQVILPEDLRHDIVQHNNESKEQGERHLQHSQTTIQNLHAQWEQEQETRWLNWEKEDTQSTYDGLFSSRDIRASSFQYFLISPICLY
jgi:hypothetical protein